MELNTVIGIVIPKFNNEIQKRYNFPVGLAYISGALKNAGYCVRGLNLNHIWEDCDDFLAGWITDMNVRIIMSGGLTADFHRIKKVFDIAKKTRPEIITIGGGGGFSSEPILFSEMTETDYSVIGEGEKTICELMHAIFYQDDITKQKGIVYKDKTGKYKQNPMQDYIDDLDSIPFPDYEEFDLEKYLEQQTTYDEYYTHALDEPRMMPIYLGRSCPFSCTFCYHPLGNKYRQRSLDNFFAELDLLLKKYKINSLGIFDELFSLNRDIIVEFCNRIRPYSLKWNIQLRVNLIDKELLDLMHDAGCASISYGIESFSKTILESMNKRITPEQIEHALSLTYDSGICIQGNFIFGDERETWETFYETLNWWRENKKYFINLAFIETYPGTKLYSNAVERGLIKDRKKFIEANCPIINMTSLSDEDFDKMRDIVMIEDLYEREEKGLIINIQKEQKEDFVSMTLQCPHCKTVTTYHNIEKMRSYSNAFKICCRKCARKSFFDTRKFYGIRDSASKYKLYFYLIRRWMISGEIIENIIKKYKSIAIWYDDELGKLLIHQLHNRIPDTIKFFLVSNASQTYNIIQSVPLCSCSAFVEFDKKYPTEAILITDIYNFLNIKKQLLKLDYKGEILSLSDVLLNIV